MMDALKAFLSGEAGAAKTQKGFLLAAAAGVILMSIYLVANGGRAPERPEGPTAQEIVLADLTNGRIRSFDPRTTARRLALYADPTEFTDAQLRNAHRTWVRRAGDHAYPDRDLAADMATITAAAMELRGVAPHDDI